MEENAHALPLDGNGDLPRMRKPVTPDLEQLTRDFRVFIADCETLLKNATTLSGSGAAVARTQLSEKMAAGKIKLDAMRTAANDRATRTRSATEDYVRREPMAAITYAAVAGAVLAFLMFRR